MLAETAYVATEFARKNAPLTKEYVVYLCSVLIKSERKEKWFDCYISLRYLGKVARWEPWMYVTYDHSIAGWTESAHPYGKGKYDESAPLTSKAFECTSNYITECWWSIIRDRAIS